MSSISAGWSLYAPFMAVRDLYEKTESITISDLTESEIIDKLVHVAVLHKDFMVWLENRQMAKLWMYLCRILAKQARAKYA